MKVINVLLALMFILAANAQLNDYGTKTCADHSYKNVETNPAFSLDFCRVTKRDSNKRCCFLEWRDTNDHRKYSCVEVSAKDYSDIDAFIEELEKKSEIQEVKSLDCKSTYLFGSLLLILFLLF
jgi:hypothetical protein